MSSVTITGAPLHLQKAYRDLFTKNALDFTAELIAKFDERVEELYWNRFKRKALLHLDRELPDFPNSTARRDPTWKIQPLPQRLLNRRVDLGDVSPANTQHFIEALNADVQGVQVDFDDGHCPTWQNQIMGFHNIYQAVRGELHDVPDLKNLPILMLRPRAWNMTEHNVMINGKKAPGPLVDFAILMFHNAKILCEQACGPYLYLSKLESATEARLWNDIFVWAQEKLSIPHGTIKACVLIENILAAFEMDEILYELRDHSLGLNCGIWDYAASIVAKFGHKRNFILPDRNKYVNMERHFLKQYMLLVINTCHARRAPATCGMSALLTGNPESLSIVQKVIDVKTKEILLGADGFLIYDLKLIPHMNKLWPTLCTEVNQIDKKFNINVTAQDLLEIPSGGVTMDGLIHNIEVAILFIYNWLMGNGHFVHKGAVEDSATAEISRSQIWQWIRHSIVIEDSDQIVSKELIENLTKKYLQSQKHNFLLVNAGELFMEVITSRHFPDFITTYLNDHFIFQQTHKSTLNKL